RAAAEQDGEAGAELPKAARLLCASAVAAVGPGLAPWPERPTPARELTPRAVLPGPHLGLVRVPGAVAVPPPRQRRLHDPAHAVDERVRVVARPPRDRLPPAAAARPAPPAPRRT